MTADRSPAAVVIPFGKHRGATVAEVLAKDPGYAEWLMAQGWLAERFAELHAAIATRGKVSDDTPEHNGMQARFLDPVYRVAFMLATQRRNIDETIRDFQAWQLQSAEKMLADANRRREWLKVEKLDGYHSKTQMELELQADEAIAKAHSALDAARTLSAAIGNVDVRFEDRGVDVRLNWRGSSAGCSVEIKPSMGDDFPSVMRQMQRSGSSTLLCREYSGRAVSEPQLREMFRANHMLVLFERDVDALMAEARNRIGPLPE
jgi:hypothetical protein